MADQGRQRANLSREVDEASRIDGSQVNSNVKSSLGDHSSMTSHLFVDFFDHLYSPWIDFQNRLKTIGGPRQNIKRGPVKQIHLLAFLFPWEWNDFNG